MKNVINSYAEERNIREINLHLGCGGENIAGWINIDNYDYESGDSSRSNASYDLKMDIRALDAASDSVDRILLVHVLEHFVRWEALELLAQFHRLLKPKGLLLMEHPDLDGCIKMYLEGQTTIDTPLGKLNKGFTQFYGNQWDRLDYETHRYVWTKKEMSQELIKAGFEVLVLDNRTRFHVPGRDMRVVARKLSIPAIEPHIEKTPARVQEISDRAHGEGRGGGGGG
ncbi:MAG: methyltransferase domain-containing protein [Deltaproteobacteria bacterium]|nr:methyltransferase domain-containing protein [Deltaproteobacteria bacterium]